MEIWVLGDSLLRYADIEIHGAIGGLRSDHVDAHQLTEINAIEGGVHHAIAPSILRHHHRLQSFIKLLQHFYDVALPLRVSVLRVVFNANPFFELFLRVLGDTTSVSIKVQHQGSEVAELR